MSNPVIVSVGTTPKKISSAGNNKKARLVRNLGAGSVFLGVDTNIEKDNANGKMGWELPAGEDFPDSISRNEIWAVSASGNNDVQVWQID